MRALSFLLILGLFGAIVPSVHATTPAYDARGSYLVGEAGPLVHNPGNPGVAVTSCETEFRSENNIFASCASFGGAAVDGLVAKLTFEGASAPLVQGGQVCFFQAYSVVIDCPPDETCTGFAWCAHVPAGAKIFGVTSGTGLQVQWRLTVG